MTGRILATLVAAGAIVVGVHGHRAGPEQVPGAPVPHIVHGRMYVNGKFACTISTACNLSNYWNDIRNGD